MLSRKGEILHGMLVNHCVYLPTDKDELNSALCSTHLLKMMTEEERPIQSLHEHSVKFLV